VQAARVALGDLRFSSPSPPAALPEAGDDELRLVAVPALWASWETERSPALDFLAARQELELHPNDAERLGVADGAEVEVASNGHALKAPVRLRQAARRRCAYLRLGTAENNANVLINGQPVLVEVRKAPSPAR
jgi:anaerobic selenocysteine-containing dehydrogenase